MRDSCLLVLTKPARPGRVKTRLIGARLRDGGGITAEQAAGLHEALLGDILLRLSEGRFELMVAWALEDGERVPELDRSSVRQQGEDLGERLFNALSLAARDHDFVGAVGSDHPDLPLAEVERGFSLLRAGVDVVLGPATDGGYYFIGVRAERLRPELFAGIEWSTPRVLEATLERCRRLGLSPTLLRETSDVDTPEDLERLWRRFEAGPDTLSSDCPQTAKWLRQWRSA